MIPVTLGMCMTSFRASSSSTESTFNNMEIDQGSSSSQEHNLIPVQGNESPTQLIRDGLVFTPGGVSSGVYTDLEPQK